MADAVGRPEQKRLSATWSPLCQYLEHFEQFEENIQAPLMFVQTIQKMLSVVQHVQIF